MSLYNQNIISLFKAKCEINLLKKKLCSDILSIFMVTNLSSSSTELQEVYMFENGLMMQYFEWYMKSEPSLWKTIQKDAEKLKKSGVTSVWLPPARHWHFD